MGELEIKRRQGRRETNAMEEKYDLKWKTYSDHLVGVFKELGEEGHFADVTLVSDDQIQTKAHKVVLSACSPVLKTLLVNNPHSHPLLYLRGIKQTELQAILKFMYFGETQIFENRINDFVSMAKDLEVKEISEEQEEKEEDSDQGTNVNEDTEAIMEGNEQTEYEQDVKEEAIKPSALPVRTVAKQSRVVRTEGKYRCDECEAAYDDASCLRRHKQAKHEGKTYTCDECDAVYTDRSHLRTHKLSKHAGIRYLC